MDLRHGEKCYSKDRSCDTLWKHCKAMLSIVQWLEVLIGFTKSLFPPSCVLCKSGCIVSSSFRWDVMLSVGCLDNLPAHSNLPPCAKHRIGGRLHSKEGVLTASPSHSPHLEICASYVCLETPARLTRNSMEAEQPFYCDILPSLKSKGDCSTQAVAGTWTTMGIWARIM